MHHPQSIRMCHVHSESGRSRANSSLFFVKTHFPLVFVIILFPLSTLLVVLSLGSLPVTVSWPRTLEDLASMGRDLHSYSQSGTMPLAHVVGVLSISAVWKHAWSVPGSVAWVSDSRILQVKLFFFSWYL